MENAMKDPEINEQLTSCLNEQQFKEALWPLM